MATRASPPALKKAFRSKGYTHWPMIEKDIIDEITFCTDNPRICLMLELMTREGMRIGEVLNLRPMDCEVCMLILSDNYCYMPRRLSTLI